jgi:Tfp pilus assembly protein PilF
VAEPARVEPIFRAFAARDPGSADAHTGSDLALFARAILQQPRSHVPQNNLGTSYLRADEVRAARDRFVAAAELEPRDFAVQNDLGLALAREGREDDALEIFRRTGSEQAAFNDLGVAAFQNGDYARAEGRYEGALLARGEQSAAVRANLLAAQRARSAEAAAAPASPDEIATPAR